MLLFRMSAFACQGPERNKYRLPTGTKSGLSPARDKSSFREKETHRSDSFGGAWRQDVLCLEGQGLR